ncbi:aminoglycoside phosphotransferase family protein [Streptomyces sp. NBC_01551]|uniref:aminoglycoside phosphotransferase family protein n=1 Tax=Streptomyces sp. NBC_01551 TaxID=2975876 RepID=UPI002259E780|nr:aminoglycoside phosphotransferase family protein [Streptomyces sp. NBC_01551]MCX4529293.1 aminoglycoside phosphotransferase family protein [Streptomyces sp. NBC_01551]
MTDIPARIEDLVTTAVGEFELVAEHSWPGPDRPQIWEVRGSDGQRWFIKRHARPKGHRREVAAYQSWTHYLGAGRAPTLVAADTGARAIVITPVAGKSMHSHPLEGKDELEAYQQAGYLLALLHSAPTDTLTQAVVGEDEWEAAVEKMLNDAALYLPADVTAMLRHLTQERPGALPAQVCHADYQPRNWLWDSTTRILRLIDFERTCVEPAVKRDLPRLQLRILASRPKVRAAFYDGFGRDLTPAERHACIAYGAQDAVSALKWGLEHQDVETVDAAHTMLENLRAHYNHGLMRSPSRRR